MTVQLVGSYVPHYLLSIIMLLPDCYTTLVPSVLKTYCYQYLIYRLEYTADRLPSNYCNWMCYSVFNSIHMQLLLRVWCWVVFYMATQLQLMIYRYLIQDIRSSDNILQAMQSQLLSMYVTLLYILFFIMPAVNFLS